jgi:hypothetical protein
VGGAKAARGGGGEGASYGGQKDTKEAAKLYYSEGKKGCSESVKSDKGTP